MAVKLDPKYQALFRSYRKTMEILFPFREAMVGIAEELADEGDRVYFGSSNHADQFKECADTLDSIVWDELINPVHKEAADLYAELEAAKADAALMRELVQVEREIQAKVCKERDHWFKLVPDGVARANPYRPLS